MNSPSPLVPQGSIAPKNTSRSARVLLIGLTVVVAHVAGLSLVLLQGCQKDAKTAGPASAETNTPSLTLPSIDNASPYYSSASNLPPSVTASAATNAAPQVNPYPVITSAPPTVATAPIGQEPPTALPQAAEESTREYKVAAKDTLSGIAAKNKVTLAALLKANPDIDPKKLKVGQAIRIPAPAAATAAPAPTATTPGNASPAPTVVASAGGTYKVKPGDTLTKIAKAHGVTVNQLRAANNMRTTQLLAGKVLKIPARATAAAPSAPAQN